MSDMAIIENCNYSPSRFAGVSILAIAIVLFCPAAEAADPSSKPVQFLLAWGKKGTAAGEFHFPIGVAINQADEVFVTDHYNNRVQKFSADGKWLVEFAVLPTPGGIAVD